MKHPRADAIGEREGKVIAKCDARSRAMQAQTRDKGGARRIELQATAPCSRRAARSAGV